MGSPWILHRFSMKIPWILHGFFRDTPWIFYGFSMAIPWIFLDFSWILHGIFLCCPWMLHGSSMDLLWRIHGLYMYCPWINHALVIYYKVLITRVALSIWNLVVTVKFWRNSQPTPAGYSQIRAYLRLFSLLQQIHWALEDQILTLRTPWLLLVKKKPYEIVNENCTELCVDNGIVK